jgi:hypothetical protein
MKLHVTNLLLVSLVEFFDALFREEQTRRRKKLLLPFLSFTIFFRGDQTS